MFFWKYFTTNKMKVNNLFFEIDPNEDDIDDDYELKNGNDNNDSENEADVTKVEQKIEQI